MDALLQLAVIVAMVLLAVGLLAARRIVFAKMAARNIVRRKKFSAIVVVGLLIATAMIAAALVVGDTMDYIIKDDVYTNTGHVDIVVAMEDDAGLYMLFNESIAYELVDSLETGGLEYIDGVAPTIREVATVIAPVPQTSVPAAYIYAYDPESIVNALTASGGEAIASDMITDGRTVVNRDLADALDVGPGDTVMLYPKNAAPVMLEVSAIAAEEGMANWWSADLLFVDLAYAQENIFAAPSMINSVDISCEGSMESGYLVTDEAVLELRAHIEEDADFAFNDVKRDGVEEAETVSDMIMQLFVLMSSFTIIAGIALIINIFVMLAEERKPEMGISRAVGMQRGHLTQSFMFEGVVYAIVASLIGTLVGLAIAFVMINAFSVIMGGGEMSFELHFQLRSLAMAAAAGFLITMATVALASWRVSRLNIVMAIRDIPEPVLAKSQSKYFLTGIAALALGVLVFAGGASSRQAAGTASGMALISIGAAMVAVRFVNPRLPFTIAGFWMIYYILDPIGIETMLFGELQGDLEMFIISGVMMVTGGTMIAMFNSDVMLAGLVRVFGRGRNLLPVFRAAISYPMNKKFRTGLSLFIFALIMFTVIVIAMLASFQRESVDTLSEKFSGGFEILGFSLREIPEDNLTAAVDEVDTALGPGVITRVETVSTASVTLSAQGSDQETSRSLVGFSDAMLSDGRFSLARRADGYATDREAWNAILEDQNLTIMDGSVVPSMFSIGVEEWYVDVGDTIVVECAPNVHVNLTIIGIMDQIIIPGAFTTKAFVQEHAVGVTETLFYLDTSAGSGLTEEEILDRLKEALAEYGLNGVVVRDIIDEAMTTAASTMQLMEVFLGVGLVVGISGLGIITIRNIAERKQEIGVMRAIGFQKRMILNVFLLETSFVSLLGILMGAALGLMLSYRLFDWGGFSEISEFVIPWGEVLLVLAVAFVITILATLPPSRTAARLAPAEALRRVD
ncbi:MAG: FtsX-like permease family protein [Methanobacteriota archaeon]|nr:MAG: FtsX-like permease family protein [Euryarchaeota archaeon]